MINVLFVCLGNICRSPLAEALFKEKISDRGLKDSFCVDSAGTSDYHIGELPDERTIASAKSHGLNISHRGRQVNRTDFRNFDYILAMDESNQSNLIQLKNGLGYSEKEIGLIRSFEPDPDSLSVPDPYYGGPEGFENVYQILDRSLDGFLAKVMEDHPEYA